jgi:hypothetical protein
VFLNKIVESILLENAFKNVNKFTFLNYMQGDVFENNYDFKGQIIILKAKSIY